ncbi:formylglycine-generating enzyme family protein [Acaryochloris sp. IP29b_bin.148]|uniref:formylglycine-generating enzyme family protein n=1 Tax=Acaryochloris sp. IP29b_bin.148 TaxID=2969218 RepID=UPI00260D99B7|nr:formylglycine-generating enzyme family protein [Acaryochloris sp. IP29b_bin.148]
MKRRQFLEYAGAAGLSLAMAEKTTALVNPPIYPLDLSTVEFEVTTVDRRGQVKQRQPHRARYFTDAINGTEFLTMVAVPSGRFWMGAAPTEAQTQSYEFPRHRVKLPRFFLSQYPITQAQWAAVATLPKIRYDLNSSPSYFQGKDRPVESVSWLEAVEFCDRISQQTGRHYQLPSEAQWEYACRAGTRTPFNTGETITSQLADYMGTTPYRAEAIGDYRQSTMAVGRLSANAFGLYDMHGNVWEWCADVWHANYRGAPRHGQGWASSRPSQRRTIRGGSWLNSPAQIRSASRSGYDQTALNRTIGFRVSLS